MPQKKQTARKTTGKHLALSRSDFAEHVLSIGQLTTTTCTTGRAASALNQTRPASVASRPKSKPKRVQHRPTATASNGPSGSRPKLTSVNLVTSPPIKPILKRPWVGVPSLPGSSAPVSVPPTTNPPPTRLNALLSTGGVSFANGTAASASGALVRRRPAVGGLDVPISVCSQFATWLENQKCVHDQSLLHAVERDGSHLLSLAKATIKFDDALRGHVPPTLNGAVSPLIEHARTLRVFAELLKSKISEGSLSEELETAVLRDGEGLLRFAINCLEFDQAIRGSDSRSSWVGG